MVAKANRQKRRYIQLSENSCKAMITAIDSFNRVHGDYKVENTLILLANGWELLAKAVLLKKKQSITKSGNKAETISGELALKKLLDLKEIDANQSDLLQQIVSLRNQCTHDVLPEVPLEIQHHLMFFSCKFFKELCQKHFPKLTHKLTHNFLTLSFDSLTTYAAAVQKIVSKLRKGTKGEKELVWLLERGLRYVDKNKYITQEAFERLYRDKKKIIPHLKIGNFIEKSDMVTIVPIQAPKNFTADITLRKGSPKASGALAVHVHSENEYQFFTNQVALLIGKNSSFVARAATKLALKGNTQYHAMIKTSSNSEVSKYNQTAVDFLRDHLVRNPTYSPFK